MLSSVIGLLIMVGFGLLIGWRPDTSPPAVLAALALLLLLRFALLWLGIYVGYRARSVESVALVQILVWPVAFVSSVFVDPATMPTWLGALAELNPVSATATTVRDLLGTASWSGQILPGWTPPVLAVTWPVVLTAVFLPLAARSFRSA
jgi:ABC-2 type transport system permease protein